MTGSRDEFATHITVLIISLAFAIAATVSWTTHNDGVLFAFAVCFIALTVIAAHRAIRESEVTI